MRCRMENCGRPIEGRNLCQMHYSRWTHHGDPNIVTRNPAGSGCLSDGYRILSIQKRRVFEHRYVMEQYLGRRLTPYEIVHHKDHNKLNNSIENLVVVTRSAHPNEHPRERGANGQFL
jgi:hypothetical protein